MSASSKKKLRKEQNAAAMTQKQQQAQKDAKSLKRYTLIFAVSMLLIVALVIGIVLYNPIDRALDRNSVALTVGDHEVNTTMLSYFYVDEINAYYSQIQSQYGEYAFLYAGILGLDLNRPLDQQEHPDEEDLTWAGFFVRNAIDKAQRLYSLYLKATEVGHKLTDEESKAVESTMQNLDLYAKYYYGYSSLESYLRACYGNSATEESYHEYETIKAMAESYYNKHYEGLEYDNDDYREFEKDKKEDYNAYTFSSYQILVNSYLDSKDGTKDEEGNINYTDAQLDAARKAALADAEALANGKYKDIAAFDKAIAALKVNEKKKDVASTLNKNQLGGKNIPNEDLRKWIAESRKEGDLTIIPITAKEEDDKEVITGYYVVRYESMTENLEQMVNIRHILLDIKTVKDKDGKQVFDEIDKAKVLKDAEKILDDFRNGKDTSAEEFGEIAKKKSVDGTKTNGGIVKDLYPGMVGDALKDFEAWCFADGRKAGDTDIVLSDHGYHIIYFESFDEFNYRDYMINANMRTEATDKWATGIADGYKAVIGDLSRMDTGRSMIQ